MIPVPRSAGNAIVQGPRTSRVGPPADATAGVAAIGRELVAGGQRMAQAQAERDDMMAQREAQQTVDNLRAAEAQRKQQQADANLLAGNAAVRYKLDSDALLRQWGDQLDSGQVTPDKYQAGLATDLRKLGQTMAKSVPEIGRQAFETGIQQTGAANVLKVRDKLERHTKDQRKAALVAGANDLERLAVTDYGQAKAAAAGLFGKDGPYAATEGAEAAAKAHQAWTERAARAHFQRRIADAHDNPQGLAGLRDEVAGSADLDPMQQSAMLSSIDSRTAVLENRALAAQERRSREARSAADGLRNLSMGGFPVSPSYASEVVATTKGTEYAAEVQELLKGASQMAGFASKPLAEQDRIVADLTAEASKRGVTPDSDEQLRKASQIRDRSRRDYAANAWQAAADRGQIDDIPPLDTSSTMGMVRSLSSRLEVLPSIEIAAGGPVSPLQPDEATGFGQVLQSLPVQDRADLLGRVRQVVGPQRMQMIAGQLSKEDPTLAVVAAAEADGLRASNGESVGMLILKGAEAIKGKQVKIDDAAGEGIQAQMREYLADAIVSPDAREAAISAAIKVWAARQVTGDTLTESEALETVTGPVVEWGGGKTLAPPGWTADEFTTAIEDLSALRITQMLGGAPMYVAGQPITPKQLADQMESVQLRQGTGGRYGFMIGSAMVTDQAGQPITLPLTKPEKSGSMLDLIRGR